MEIIQKILKKTSGDRLLRTCILLVLFSFASIRPSIAQTDSLTDSASTAVVDTSGGPSLAHLTKNLGASEEELKRIHRDEILSYVYMGLGFSVVIAIAWFTTVLARKRKKKEDEIKAMRLRQMKNKLHPPRR